MNSAAANPMTLLEELQAMILATTGRGIEAVSEAARDLVSLPPQTDFSPACGGYHPDPKSNRDVR